MGCFGWCLLVLVLFSGGYLLRGLFVLVVVSEG